MAANRLLHHSNNFPLANLTGTSFQAHALGAEGVHTRGERTIWPTRSEWTTKRAHDSDTMLGGMMALAVVVCAGVTEFIHFPPSA